jgi:hypothetical protein
MHYTTFSIQESFETAWEILKKKFEILAGALAFMFLLSCGFSFLKHIVDPEYYNVNRWDHHSMMWGYGVPGNFDYRYAQIVHQTSFIEMLMGLVVSLIGCIVITIIAIGVTRLYFKVFRHEPVHFRQVIQGEDRFIEYFLAALLSAGAIVLGFIFFIIPGLYIALRLSLVKLYVVDRKIDPLESLTLSWHATRGQAWQLFGFLLASIGINFLGALAFGIGLLVTLPLTFLAFIDVYEKLSHRHQTAS